MSGTYPMSDPPTQSLFRIFLGLLLMLSILDESHAAMTAKQLEASMDMMRGACAPKFAKLTTEDLDNLRAGRNMDVDNKDLKCYTTCIAQMAGTITKKKEINIDKTLAQMDTMLPNEMKGPAKEAIMACKDIQSGYKDVCDRTWFTVKCIQNYNPEMFGYP